MPARSSDCCVAAPTPQIKRTGLSRKIQRFSARPITENPCGLFISDAILAKNLLRDNPIDPVSPNSVRMRTIRRANTTAGGKPCSFCVPGTGPRMPHPATGFDGRGHFQHHLPNLAADIGVNGHTRFDNHRIRAQFTRLKHGHRRFHAMNARYSRQLKQHRDPRRQ